MTFIEFWWIIGGPATFLAYGAIIIALDHFCSKRGW